MRTKFERAVVIHDEIHHCAQRQVSTDKAKPVDPALTAIFSRSEGTDCAGGAWDERKLKRAVVLPRL